MIANRKGQYFAIDLEPSVQLLVLGVITQSTDEPAGSSICTPSCSLYVGLIITFNWPNGIEE